MAALVGWLHGVPCRPFVSGPGRAVPLPDLGSTRLSCLRCSSWKSKGAWGLFLIKRLRRAPALLRVRALRLWLGIMVCLLGRQTKQC